MNNKLMLFKNIEVLQNEGTKKEYLHLYNCADWFNSVTIEVNPTYKSIDDGDKNISLTAFGEGRKFFFDFKSHDAALPMFNDLIAVLRGESDQFEFDYHVYRDGNKND